MAIVHSKLRVYQRVPSGASRRQNHREILVDPSDEVPKFENHIASGAPSFESSVDEIVKYTHIHVYIFAGRELAPLG